MPFSARASARDLVVGPARVAAVDDRVALVQQVGQRVHRLLGGVTGGHHDPHRPRRLELGDQVLQGGRAGGAVLLGLLHRVLGEVEGHHLVVRVAVDAMDHVAAHLSQPYEAELHAVPPIRGRDPAKRRLWCSPPHSFRGTGRFQPPDRNCYKRSRGARAIVASVSAAAAQNTAAKPTPSAAAPSAGGPTSNPSAEHDHHGRQAGGRAGRVHLAAPDDLHGHHRVVGGAEQHAREARGRDAGGRQAQQHQRGGLRDQRQRERGAPAQPPDQRRR